MLHSPLPPIPRSHLPSSPLPQPPAFRAHTRTCRLRSLRASLRDASAAGDRSAAQGGESPATAPAAATAIPRRTLLQSACALGSLHALAGARIASADALPAAASTMGALAARLDERVSEFSLANGMRFLVYERRSAPVVSFHTYADVGAFDEEDGATGLAHLLEHLAFKGGPRVGTKDSKGEAVLLDALDEVFYSLRDASNPLEVARLRAQLGKLQAQAAELSKANEYGSILQREGAVGLNATTSHDSTKYFVSLPANKMELWFAMEAERFQAPVFRELYSEKKVVFEERRLRVDNTPLGPFQEDFALQSLSNNYRRPVIGFASDLERLGRREVASFFEQHYGPSSITVAVVGDCRPEQVRRMAERYFGGWRSDARPGLACGSDSLSAAEEPLPRPDGKRELTARSRAGPAVLRAWYRPCVRSGDSLALDCVNDLLTGSRSSRLYRSLVLGGGALSTTSFASFPAEKHPSQLVLYGIPAPGSTAQRLDGLMQQQVAQLAEGGPTPEELRRYAKAARTGVFGVLQSNSSMAGALASYQVLEGGWRGLVEDLERTEALTPSQVRDTAARYLVPDNSFVGYVMPV